MAETIRSWILSLAGAAVLSAVALAVTPDGPVRSVTKMVCGAVMALTLISPIFQLNLDIYSLGMAEYREEVRKLTGKLDETQDRLNRIIIQEECGAYIWDKAQDLGMQMTQADVTVKWGDDCWVPWEANLKATGTDSQRSALSDFMEAELGIPKERQYWNEDE